MTFWQLEKLLIHCCGVMPLPSLSPPRVGLFVMAFVAVSPKDVMTDMPPGLLGGRTFTTPPFMVVVRSFLFSCLCIPTQAPR